MMYWRDQFRVDAERNAIELLVTTTGGCQYSSVASAPEVAAFRDRVPEIVNRLVTEGRLVGVAFNVPVLGRVEFLFPPGTVQTKY